MRETDFAILLANSTAIFPTLAVSSIYSFESVDSEKCSGLLFFCTVCQQRKLKLLQKMRVDKVYFVFRSTKIS